MTDNTKEKVISRRPKVRFYQFSDNARNKTKIVGEDCKEQIAPRANGPRIKEIVSLKRPIRVVDPVKSASVCDKDVSMSNCNIDTLSHYDTTILRSGDTRDMALSDKNRESPKVESTMIRHDANGIRNTKKNCKASQLDKSSQDDILKDHTRSLRQKGKESKHVLSKRATSTKDRSVTRTENLQRVQSIIQEKLKLSTGNNHKRGVNDRVFKRPKMTKSQSAPNIMKGTRNLIIQGGMLDTKPVSSCRKTVAKNKISPVKKIALRNISGPKIKTFVGPGIFRKGQANAKASDANETRIVTLDIDVEDLGQPEYNSIICTINKLKELEQRKVVTDISHLPSELKSFLNGKISAALDFPLDETIYKNLIDLSIDEKQLPPTITRSKDPEPRQKDIVPKLSDFFIFEDTKEICEAVHVKSRASKLDDNWNAFKISDRILEWKYSIDDID